MVKSPSSLVVATRAIAVCSLVSMTLALAITLPEASTPVPEIVPVMDWAIAGTHRNAAQNRQDNNFAHCNLMEDIRTSSTVDRKVQHKLTLCVALSSE